MSGKGNCFDNAVAESFFATLKKELVRNRAFETRAAAHAEVFKYIEVFYNRRRAGSPRADAQGCVVTHGDPGTGGSSGMGGSSGASSGGAAGQGGTGTGAAPGEDGQGRCVER